MQLQNISIEKATVDCTRALEDFARDIKHSGGDEYYLYQYELQQKGGRDLLIAWGDTGEDRRVAGYVVFNRDPKYGMFRKLGIAEAQDLIVHPDYRRCGIARNDDYTLRRIGAGRGRGAYRDWCRARPVLWRRAAALCAVGLCARW